MEGEDADEASLWQRLRDVLRGRLSTQVYATWVSQMHCVQDDGSVLGIGLPNLFTLDWINNHYKAVLEEELAKLSAARLELRLLDASQGDGPAPEPEPVSSRPSRIVVPSKAAALTAGPRAMASQRPQPASAAPSSPPTQGAEPLSLNRRYTFSSFVTGPSNELASAAAHTVSERPGTAYNPLFIFGRVGLGKTHLLQAIGHAILKKNPSARVLYQTTETFVNDVIQGIRFNRMDEVRRVYRACDVLLIDDIQFIAGKETCQEEFFHTFNSHHDQRRQVVVTSDKLPHEIKDLEERVRSRFQWGLVVDLQPPELETRIAILRKKADSDGIPLADDVAMFIAQSVRSNVRELEGCLIRLSAYASLQGQPITIALAKNVLKDVMPPKSQVLTCDVIVKAVAAHFDVKVADLKSTRRGKTIALPRQIAMYLCRKHTGSSYPEIGQALGGKDHTTALNAFNRIKERLDEPEVRRHVDEVERALLD
ncbi:chromosomal replication initiator protein DnaA [Myxococcota bacterium]|nr:chromosomal replication initiator protein DnaA [Myxococcota bacterium]